MIQVRGVVITSTANLIMVGGTKSSPDDFFGFRLLIAFLTSASVTGEKEK